MAKRVPTTARSFELEYGPGYLIYGIHPSVPDLPELSAGIMLLRKNNPAARQSNDIWRLLSNTRLEDAATGWTICSVASANDFRNNYILRKTRPLSECYQPGLAWDDEVRAFLTDCVTALAGVAQYAINAIIQWDKNETES